MLAQARAGVTVPPEPDSLSAESAQRLSAAGAGLPLQGRFDQLADDFAVDGMAGQAGHDRFHDLPHVFEEAAPDSVTTTLTSWAISSVESAAGR